MKTAISIPEEVFRSAEVLAKRLGLSRSQLYAVAVNEYVSKNQDRQVTALLDSVYGKEDSSLHPGILGLQAGSLGREDW